MLGAAGRWLKIITFAPERPGGAELARYCREQGIVAACGHSAATLAQVRGFAEGGVLHLTHLFNGMSGVRHRTPGVAAAGLVLDRMTADFICDGVHVDPEMVRLILRCRQPENLILITNRVSIGSSADTGPNLFPDGRLAGSRLTLIRAVQNLIQVHRTRLAGRGADGLAEPGAAHGNGGRMGQPGAGQEGQRLHP